MRKSLILYALVLGITGIALLHGSQGNTRTVNIGYFEGGPYPTHNLLRDEYLKQLHAILPDTIQIVTIPHGYRSADWKRANSKMMARELAHLRQVDMVMAFGPWAIYDLLEAGFDKPIIGMHQFDVKLDGLLNEQNRPIKDNLIVCWQPDRLTRDFTILSKLTDKRKLGFLYFPADTLNPVVREYVNQTAALFGFVMAYGEGYNNDSTYAFFKAYHQINHRIDILYLPPLWGLESNLVRSFFEEINQERKPGFIAEGSLILEKGALATADYYAVIAQARFFAERTKQIIFGATPASLPVIFTPDFTMAVNGQTAAKCGISISENIKSFYYVIDPPPDESATRFTLSDALFKASQQNPSYLAALDYEHSARFATDLKKRYFYPRLQARAMYQYLDDNTVYNSYDYYNNEQAKLSMELSQPLFSLRKRREISSSTIAAELSSTRKIETQMELEKTLSHAFLACLRYESLRQNAINYRKIIDYYLQLSQARNVLGENQTVPIARLETYRSKINRTLLDIEQNLRNSKVHFNALMNLPGDAPFTLDESGFSENDLFTFEGPILDKLDNQMIQNQVMDTLLKKAFTQHPFLQSARSELSLEKSRLKEIEAGKYPSLNLNASLHYADRLRQTLFFDEKHTTWSIGGSLDIPLFDGGERHKKSRQIQSEISAREYEVDDAGLEVMKAVRSAFNTLISKAFTITAAYKAKTYSVTARDEITDQYTQGEISLTEFFTVLTEANEADVAFINSRYEYYESICSLYYSLGQPAGDKYSNPLEQMHSILAY